jgi:hypothetical protein
LRKPTLLGPVSICRIRHTIMSTGSGKFRLTGSYSGDIRVDLENRMVHSVLRDVASC